MNPVYEKLQTCYASFRQKINFTPRVALVLGSGLGDYAEDIRMEATLDYCEIEGFPISTVPGHKGRFVFGYVGEVPVVCMQGRVHYYEGYDITDVVLPTRLMKMMGAEFLFLTNAAGGVNREFSVGDFMMITDQIASFVPSPLVGPNMDELGLRFFDMTEVYDRKLQGTIRAAADHLQIPLREGTYLQFSGPAFETPAEIQMVARLGGDAVGMSTAVEATAANHMGMKICGISCITNMAAGISDNPLSHEEVQETADRVALLFKSLVTEVITRMGEMR